VGGKTGGELRGEKFENGTGRKDPAGKENDMGTAEQLIK